MLLFPVHVKAQEDFYYIYNNEELIEQFDDYDDAYDYYRDYLDEYPNLIMKKNDDVVHMEYGIVEFKKTKACDLIVEYHSDLRDVDDYFNPCYGVDAAYLSTNSKASEVYFKLSGDLGSTSIDNVILHPFESLNVKPSLYENNNDYLIHKIKTQLDQDYYSFSLTLDNSLDYLDKNKEYYSYDGHYFYDDFYLMIDDYRQDTYEHAINSEAYYNYFQYLPYRSISNYNSEDLEEYFYNTLGINGRLLHYVDYDGDSAADEVNRSQLYGQLNNFLIYQYMYGTNGMMLLSSAINESSYGKNLASFSNNNLYQTAAYETENEKNYSRYDTIDNSIYSHSKYIISSIFSNHLRSDYAGTNYGDKASGINTNYSLDPYYGQRNSATYFELDRKLGARDYNNYAIGIIKDESRVRFYEDAQLDDRRLSITDIKELALIILGEYEDSYKVQIDHSFNDEYLYDFETSVAYVSKDVFDVILNPEKIKENSYKTVHYDFNGGTFHDYQSLDLKYRDDDLVLDIVPSYHLHEFVEYDENYVAQYRKINEIRLNTFDKNNNASNIDLRDWQLIINYEDGQTDMIPVNSDMINSYKQILEQQIINVRYAEENISEQVDYQDDESQVYENILKAIEDKDYDYVKENIHKTNYPLSFSQIRTIDYDLKEKQQRNYVIKDNGEKYNLSISGLDLSLADKNSFSLVDDTYYVIVDNISQDAENKIMNLAAGYGFKKVEGIDISFRFNFQDIELQGPAIVQIALEDKKNDLVYSVYHLTEDGDIIKCRTTQSDNYIQFMIKESGSYEVLSMPSVNEYYIEDQTEDLSYENMGYDNHKINLNLLMIILLALLGIIGIIVYYIFNDKSKKLWKDYKKSLRIAESVQEEKPKN